MEHQALPLPALSPKPSCAFGQKSFIILFLKKRGRTGVCVCDSEGTDRGGDTLKVTGMAWHG